MSQIQAAPECYLSTSEGAWRVIHQGMPLCADMPTRRAAESAARQLNATPANKVWDGDRGIFVASDDATVQ